MSPVAVYGQRLTEGIGTGEFLALVGVTPATLHRWRSDGLFGAPVLPGQGHRVQWSPADVEVAWAVKELTALGASSWWTGRSDALGRAAVVVRTRRVAEGGEVLVCAVGRAPQRHEHWCARPADLSGGVLVVPLRPYPSAAVAAAPSSVSPSGASRPDEGATGMPAGGSLPLQGSSPPLVGVPVSQPASGA